MTGRATEHRDICLGIGRNIRRRRLRLGLSRKAVADRLGVALRQVQRYEGGTGALSCDHLLLLAALLGCNVDDLCMEALEATAASAPPHPWNPHRVHALVGHFNRIRSHAVRDQVCGLVRTIADLVSGDAPATP